VHYGSDSRRSVGTRCLRSTQPRQRESSNKQKNVVDGLTPNSRSSEVRGLKLSHVSCPLYIHHTAPYQLSHRYWNKSSNRGLCHRLDCGCSELHILCVLLRQTPVCIDRLLSTVGFNITESN